MATRVARGKIRLAAFDGPSSKTPLETQKNLADISYTDRVIVYFSQNSLPWQQGSPGEKFKWQIR